jgi:hypothetical protein
VKSVSADYKAIQKSNQISPVRKIELFRRLVTGLGWEASPIDITSEVVHLDRLSWKLDTDALNEFKASNIRIEVDNSDRLPREPVLFCENRFDEFGALGCAGPRDLGYAPHKDTHLLLARSLNRDVVGLRDGHLNVAAEISQSVQWDHSFRTRLAHLSECRPTDHAAFRQLNSLERAAADRAHRKNSTP